MFKTASQHLSWRTVIVLPALAVACLVANEVQAQDSNWANWRGPEQNGISRDTNLVDDWSLEPRKNVGWVAETGGRATPIILNGRVYLNCRTIDDVNDPVEKVNAREQVVCWDLKTGKEIWRDKFNVFQTDIPAPRVGWASMCGDTETGNVYMHSVSGLLRCYSPDGKIVWEISLAEKFGKISGYGGRTQTPIIDEDRLIVSFMATNWGATKGPAPKHYYYAFDKKTGDLQWVSAPGGQPKDTNYSVPVVAVIKGQRQLIGGNCDGHIYSINARTGKPIWSFKMSLRGLNTTPAVDGNYVYISHGEDNIDNTKFGRVQCIDATGTGDVTETHSVWRRDGLKAGYTALVAKENILYVVSDTGNLYAYDGKTGADLWEFDLGTVGKGSPIWADGKLYATEVNGNMWIVKPSREGCEKLSHVNIKAKEGSGLDEIYASPATAEGRVILVTRDRTICIYDEAKQPVIAKPMPLSPESPKGDIVDMVQLRPYEKIVSAGSKTAYTVHAFDANGREILKQPANSLVVGKELAGFTTQGNQLMAPQADKDFAGTVTTQIGANVATARVRMFNPAKVWKWDFTGYKGPQVPAQWTRAFVKIKPGDVDGETVMAVNGGTDGKGRPSHQVGLGFAEMKNYTIQADVRMTEEKRKLPSIGLSNQRYNLIMKGNLSKLSIQSWPAHKRMGKEIKFRSDPDIWYTMKMKVEVTDGIATVSGKVWKRDEEEPAEWTITQKDPHPNESGSPGLYYYALADCYFDNVVVTQN
ncbi:MAG: PQQ-binding-like beta-propeller repeat protein [Planctomycetota bacterium]